MIAMAKKTPEQISYNMQQVKNKDSKIEVLLRKELWNRGLRYTRTAYTIRYFTGVLFHTDQLTASHF